MKVLILAGGYGTRISEYTDAIPKPMIEVGGKPLIWHIMQHYAYYGYKEFVIALGYKGEVFKKYFLDYRYLYSDFTINLFDGSFILHKKNKDDWKITLVDTGVDTMTGGRIKKIKKYINNSTFLCTYGDAFSDVDIKKLVEFHKKHKKIATLTAVRPIARFGELSIDKNTVTSFIEKPQLKKGWINGGFFVFEPTIFDYIKNSKTMLEREPMEKLSKEKNLIAYCHEGFWKCCDSKKDLGILQNMWNLNKANWILNK